MRLLSRATTRPKARHFRSNTRQFFSLSTEPLRYQERKIFAYSQKELYQVVTDVQSYHLFVPFCTASRVLTSYMHQQNGREILRMDAELSAGFLSFNESYVSKVTGIPFDSVEAVASSSTTLFKTLSTTWRFQPTAAKHDAKTLVTFDLTYAFQNPLHATVSASFFGQVSRLTVKAFEDRCYLAYGSRP